MKYISLFSGIGGIDLGLDWAGMECICQVEKDDFCQKVLQKHWPNVPKFKDVRDVGKHNLPTGASLIAAGFPCQPHSYAGKRAASKDERDLWPETARIVREYLPEWFLGENVSGLLSSEAGRFFGGILGDLAASGYDVEWQSIPAAAFGAPHIRERVFILAHYQGFGVGELSIPAWGSRQDRVDPNGVREYVPNPNGDQHKSSTHAKRRQATAKLSSDSELNGRKQGSETFQGWQSVFTVLGRNDGGSQNNGRLENTEHWATEPAVGRVANGVPRRVDRLRALGGAVVPQVAEYLGLCILQAQERIASGIVLDNAL